MEYYFGTASGYNNPKLVAQCREVFRRVLGDENEIVYEPAMGGEDFSYYGKLVPGLQFRVGVARPDRPELTESRLFPGQTGEGVTVRSARLQGPSTGTRG